MTEWQKQEAYEELFAEGRQAQNLWKYIPQSKADAVADAFSDSDGYWLYLEEGCVAYDGAEDCGIIHEYTVEDLRRAIKTIRRDKR